MGLDLTEEQIERYSRNIILPEVGGEGQRKLLASSAFVVGAGGLGSPALLYLAAAGVGRIGVADSDAVELSNLQRQVIHRTADLGTNKTLSARQAIEALNPDCTVEVVPQRLTAENVRSIIKGYDVVLDASDNFPTRFLVSDACFLERIPLVSAAVLGLEGQLMTILPGPGNPCYRCFLPGPPPSGQVPTCQEAGVLGSVVGVMGSLQATEALKLLLGIGEPLARRLIVYDALEASFRTASRSPDPECRLCGPNATITEVVEQAAAPCCPGGECDVG